MFSRWVTPNKMQGHFWHMLLAQFFMLFHEVALLLLSMVAFLTIFLLAENLQQPIRVFEIGGYWSCHGEQNASYHVKEDKNLFQKMVSKVTLHFVWGHLSIKQTVSSLMKQFFGTTLSVKSNGWLCTTYTFFLRLPWVNVNWPYLNILWICYNVSRACFVK